MLRFVNGDLLAADCQALVNTVNCVGVMGKGIARSFRLRYPKMFHEYVDLCVSKYPIEPGGLFVYRIPVEERRIVSGTRPVPEYVINFATKDHWMHSSKYEWIDKGLWHLLDAVLVEQIRSIAIPPLGCGNGGLSWPRVKDKIIKWYDILNRNHQDELTAYVYSPVDNFTIEEDHGRT